MLTAAWAADVVIIDVFLHFFLGPCIYTTLNGNAILSHVVLDQLVGTETLLTCLTVHQRIREATKMSGSNPGLGVHEDRAVNTYVIRALLNEFLPPCFLYIVFQLNTKVAVIPGVCETAIDLGTRINKSSGFCQCYDFFHCFFHRQITSLFYLNIIQPVPSGVTAE